MTPHTAKWLSPHELSGEWPAKNLGLAGVAVFFRLGLGLSLGFRFRLGCLFFGFFAAVFCLGLGFGLGFRFWLGGLFFSFLIVVIVGARFFHRGSENVAK